jgi:hypothetical protein
MRDHMILFQDYYDANTLFSFLIHQSVFLGGELGNADCWYVPPSFFQTYWFLMPNHRRKVLPIQMHTHKLSNYTGLFFFFFVARRLDNAIEMALKQGRTLSRMMFQRKKMYLEREKYADYFPPLRKPW